MQESNLNFAAATRSFMGHLEGTGSSSNTLRNYRSDVEEFRRFLEARASNAGRALALVSERDIEDYREFLKVRGLKANSRRRKQLTVRRFVRYLAKRRKLRVDVASRIAAPERVERIPETLPIRDLLAKLVAMPEGSLVRERNRALAWLMAETGCLLSEAVRADAEDLDPEGLSVLVRGREERRVPLSKTLANRLRALSRRGALFSALSPGGRRLGVRVKERGVEFALSQLGRELGLPTLGPRLIRQSVAFGWAQDGIPKSEIARRLGVKKLGAAEIYRSAKNNM